MDLLFQKWWLHALMKPEENGLLKSCAIEHVFIMQLMPVLKVLKNVLYGKLLDDPSSYAISVNSYITAKK